uniref:Uncharacterized protein n=1 Tax=Rhizophora mucronata TaxID=61149 RepID=A0A2P2P4F2_RHIMU
MVHDCNLLQQYHILGGVIENSYTNCASSCYF